MAGWNVGSGWNVDKGDVTHFPTESEYEEYKKENENEDSEN